MLNMGIIINGHISRTKSLKNISPMSTPTKLGKGFPTRPSASRSEYRKCPKLYRETERETERERDRERETERQRERETERER